MVPSSPSSGDGSRIPGREPEPCESSGHLVPKSAVAWAFRVTLEDAYGRPASRNSWAALTFMGEGREL